jgi:dsDNA-specific endonuclease/ATPase MutS2
MNKKTLTKLEYHKIIDILIEQATSFGGKERCKRLKSKPHKNRLPPHLPVSLRRDVLLSEAVIRSGNP